MVEGPLVWEFQLARRDRLHVASCEWNGRHHEAESPLRGAALRTLAARLWDLCAPDGPWMVPGVIGGSRLSSLAEGRNTLVVEEGEKLRFASLAEIEGLEAARQSLGGLS